MAYLSYHPLAWVEVGTEPYAGNAATYPALDANGLARDFDGNTFIRGGGTTRRRRSATPPTTGWTSWSA